MELFMSVVAPIVILFGAAVREAARVETEEASLRRRRGGSRRSLSVQNVHPLARWARAAPPRR